MTEAATLAGQRVSSAVIHVPPVGPWWADLVLEESPTLPAGPLDLVVAGITLRGTVEPDAAGVFVERLSLRFIGGANAWGNLIPARPYHNDSQIQAIQVAQDAASEAGETLGTFEPGSSTIGIDFVREAGPASRTLEAAIGGAQWWVNFDGTTQVGSRATSTPDSTTFEVLDFDPVSRLATIALDDLSALSIGSVLPADQRLGETQTIRSLRFELDAETMRVLAWCGPIAGTRSREAAALERIVSAIVDRRMLVPREYRVMQMNGDRVDLQSTASDTSPDLTAISFRGMAGIAARLVVGSLVIVQWIDGNPAKPMITHAIGKDGNGWAPTSLSFDATGASASIVIGAGATETPAWASKLLAELNKIVTTLGTGTSPSGAVTFGTPYVAPVSAASLGAAKTVIA